MSSKPFAAWATGWTRKPGPAQTASAPAPTAPDGGLFAGRRHSLTLRLVVSAALWTFVALALTGLLLAFLFRDSVERNFDARLNVLLESLIVSADFRPGQGVVLTSQLVEPRFEQPYAGWYWQITPRQGQPLVSRSLWDQELSPDLSETAPQPQSYYAMGPDNQEIRVVERDITYPGASGPIRFSVAAVTTENDREVSAFVWVMAWALGLFGVGLLVALVVQVRYGLRPLRDVQTALGEVRSGDAERLEGQFPQEIEPVVDELNALIDHNAEIVARARTHVGNLAHALKTPISVLSNEAQADDTDLGQSVRKQVDVMRRHVDHYLVRARAAGTAGIIGARTPVLPVLESLGNTLSRIYAEKRLKFSVSADGNLRFRGERQDLEEMLGNLMDNAAKWAQQQVAVAVQRSGGELFIRIDDDGPGISQAKREAVFARGERLDEAVAGSGLGLSIVRDIAGLYGGRVELDDSKLGGLSATLVLPAAADAVADPSKAP